MNEFDDFDIGPQSDEFVPSYYDEVADFYGIDEIDLEECDLLGEDEVTDDDWTVLDGEDEQDGYDWDSFDWESDE